MFSASQTRFQWRLARRTSIFALFCIFFAGSFLDQTQAQTYTWRTVEIGGGGFVTGTVFHPAEPGLAYARTDVGGIYRLDAATNRWIALNDDIGGLNNEFQHLGVLSIGVDPSDANRLYIATGQYGGAESWKLPSRVYRSTNRGATWAGYTTPGFKMAGNGEGRGTGERFAVNPTNGAIILLGTSDQGIWRSTDYGVTWAKTSFTPTATNFLLYAPAIAPGPGPARRVYAAATTLTGQSFWFSDDNGITWSEVANHPGKTVGREMMPLQGSFDAAGVLYSTWADATGPANYATDYGVWKMSADGSTWTSILPPTGQGFFAGISADPRVAGHVVVSTLQRWWPGDEVYRSTDGGATWTAALRAGTRSVGNSPWSSSAGPHWMTDIDIDPFNSNRAIFNTGFGLFQTTTLAASGTARTWTFFNDGLEESVPLGLHSPTAGPPLVSVIGDYTGFRHDNLNRSPRRGMLNPGSGSTSLISGADLAPSKMIRQNSGTTLYSQDSGATWAAFPTSPAPAINGQYRVILSADGQRLLWSPPGSPAYVSTDNGATWTVSANSQSLTNSNGTATASVLAGAAGVPDITNGTGGSARFNSPAAIAIDSAGVRYVADSANHTIRKIAAGGAVSTFAGGAGVPGSTNATGTSARFNSPSGIAVDASGVVYVADTANHTIRKITSAGVVTTFAGAVGLTGYTDATGTTARFNAPVGLAVDSLGNVFVCDTGNHIIRKITSAGVVTTVAGSPGLSGTTNANGMSARFNAPQGIALDSAGNLYVADSGNHAIRRIASNGDVTTFAGLPGTSGSTDATGSAARLNNPKGITLDTAGVIHVADTGNHTIRKITSAGSVTTVAGLAGTSGTANGAGTTARFNAPAGIVSTPDGINVYVADTASHTIRRNTIYNTLTPLADRVDPLRLYLWDNTAKRLLTSTDGGANFSTVASGVNSAFALFRTVPGNTGHIWARAGGSGLHRSTNFGATFTKLSSVAEVYQFDFGMAKPGNSHPAVFIWGKVGTTVGFYRSDDIGVTWTRINTNLQNFGYINDLAGDPRTYGRVYLGTSGRGVVVGELVPAVAPSSQTSTLIFGDSVSTGWNSASTSGVNLGSTATVRRGSAAISVPAASASASYSISFNTAARSTIGVDALSFWVSGGASSSAPPLRIGASRGGVTLEAYPVSVPQSGGWQRVLVPLSELGLDNIQDLTGLRIEAYSVGGVLPSAYFLDDIALIGATDYTTPVQIHFANLTPGYDGTPKSAVVTTTPAGRGVTVTYNGSPNPPSAIGSYTVAATLLDPFAVGSATETFRIRDANASIQFGSLVTWADGTPQSPPVTTTPAGLSYVITFNGSPTPPSSAGSYTVVASITDPLYAGSATATFTIRQPGFSPAALTGWTSNIAGKVTAADTANPVLSPDDTTDGYSTNTLQAHFPVLRLLNIGDTVTVTGSFQLGSSGTGNASNWFRFGLFDNQGQSPGVTTGWLGGASIGGSHWERTASSGLFTTGTGATQRTPDSIPVPVSLNSPAGNPPISFEAKATRLGNGVALNYLLRRTDTNAILLNYRYTDTTPNNNGALGSAAVTETGYIPSYTTAGFAFARSYVGANPAAVQFTGIRVAFTSGLVLQDQFITFPRPADRRLDSAPFALVATASSGLPVSFSVVSGPATLSGGTLTLTGAGLVTVRATQAGNETYGAAPAVEQSFVSNKLPATLTLGSLVAEYDGTPKTPSATTSPAGLVITYEFDGSATAPSAVGAYNVTASIQDSTYQGEASGTFVIERGPQTVTFPSLGDRGVGATFTPGASSSSGLPVVYTVVSGPATTNGATITVTGLGAVTIRATQEGNQSFLAATPVDQVFNAVPGAATVTLGGLTAMYDGQPKAVAFTTNPPGLAVSVTYSGSTTPPSARGTYVVVATVNDPRFTGSATGELVITPRVVNLPLTGWSSSNSTITVDAPATSSPVLNASGLAGGASGHTLHAFFGSVPLANAGDKLTLTGTVALSQDGVSGQSNWVRFGLFDNRGQPSSTLSGWLGYVGMGNGLFERTNAAASAIFTSTSDATQRGPDASPTPVSSLSPAGAPPIRFEVSVTRTVAGVVGASTGVIVTHSLMRTDTNATLMRYSYTDTSPNNSGSVSGSNTTANPAYIPSYSCAGFAFASNYVAASNPAAAIFSNVQLRYEAAIDAPAQTITFAPMSDVPYSATPVSLVATSSAGLPVVFELIAGPATLSGSTLVPTGIGAVTVRATQPGTITVPPAAPIERTFEITKAAATITLGELFTVYDGAPKAVSVTTAPSGLPVVVTYDGQPIPPSAVGSYVVSAMIDDPLYQGETTGNLVIRPIVQSIAFPAIADRIFGDAPFSLQASTTSGLPVTFSLVSGPASLDGPVVSLTGAGSVTVRASQSGDFTHAPATDVERTFQVAKASALVLLGNLSFTYDGTPKSASVSTLPLGLSVAVTYDGAAQPPSAAGTYAVVATIDDANYAGSAAGSLVISAPPVAPAVAITSIAGNYELRVPSLPGYAYQLQRATDLVPGAWVDLGAVRNGTGETILFTDPALPALPRRFYRIVISPASP